MLIFHHYRSSLPLIGGLFIGLTGACSREPARAPAADSAAAAVPANPSESGVAGAESTTPYRGDTTRPAVVKVHPAPESLKAKPPSPTPQVRPSIDPGRKAPPTKPATPAVPAAASDSAPTAAPSAAASPAAETGDSKWLTFDAGTNTVTFELTAGPFNWNGYTNGGATLVVPPKATVVMNFVNKDGTPHSAEIISGSGPIPNAAGDPAIPRAYTNKALEGLPQEGSDVMRFTAPESGSYRIFCGVPGHGLSGMWIWMKVDPTAKTPSFGPTKG